MAFTGKMHPTLVSSALNTVRRRSPSGCQTLAQQRLRHTLNGDSRDRERESPGCQSRNRPDHRDLNIESHSSKITDHNTDHNTVLHTARIMAHSMIKARTTAHGMILARITANGMILARNMTAFRSQRRHPKT